jgi:methionine-rich copper-binding protein CopC
MNYRPLIAAAAMLALSSIAFAHTHLKTSLPADNAVLSAAPSEIALHFSAPTRLTALTLKKEGDAERKLGPLPKEAAADFSVPVTSLTSGKYTVSWRAVGADNHVMSGDVHFTVGQ